jgi:hypothetical protein
MNEDEIKFGLDSDEMKFINEANIVSKQLMEALLQKEAFFLMFNEIMNRRKQKRLKEKEKEDWE